MHFDDVIAVLRSLRNEGVEYVLIGGVAVGLHGFERATNDIDLFVRPTEENIERLRRALKSIFNDPAIDEITAGDLAGVYPTVRYGPPEGDYLIDIIGRLGTAVAFDDLAFEPTEVAGTLVNLATPRTLYEMKRDTVRPVDRVDAEVLRNAFELQDRD